MQSRLHGRKDVAILERTMVVGWLSLLLLSSACLMPCMIMGTNFLEDGEFNGMKVQADKYYACMHEWRGF